MKYLKHLVGAALLSIGAAQAATESVEADAVGLGSYLLLLLGLLAVGLMLRHRTARSD